MGSIASVFANGTPAGFLPHGYCIAWQPGLLALHVASDALIAVSYYSIPLTLLYFLSRRPMPGYNWVLGLFAGFILACGTTHLIAILTLWEPFYWFEGWVKAGTAGISLLTALLIWPLVPRVLALPTPSQLRTANEQLRQEIDVRQRAETELRGFQSQLERLVEARTADLERAKEELQREVAERTRLDQYKDELLAIVSHELRTPLTSIGGSLHLLTTDDSIGDDEQRELADIALRNTERMIRLVNSLLDMDRIESGRTEFDAGPVSMAELAGTAVLHNQMLARQCDVGLQLGEGDEPAMVNGDADRLMQVLTNLISNAVKHAPRGSVVRVAVRLSDDVVRVEVSDDGPGVPAEYSERVFERFMQVPGRPDSAADGVGLGLSIARAIVQRHEGRIGVTSPPGGGSVFHFELAALPPSEAAAVEDVGAAAGRSSGAVPDAKRHGSG